MATATVTSKGQVTIPAQVRRDLGLKSGSRVSFLRTDNGAYELVPETATVTSLKGCITAPSTPVSLERMEAAVADAAAEASLR
ncbi:MAG: AbrB/MazE/SpoVT family DNA-binding domain-containing protein [Egibacteraceae bacterium]